jgi:ubiquinone/menaquinone biosynthesis C-methylase UbiE
MSKKGVQLTKEEFHRNVNIIFHDIESKTYDFIHCDMENSLQEQFNLLASDVLKDIPNIQQSISILDIGCGTGMSIEKLLNTNLRPFVSELVLLDTSAGMLNKCGQKAKTWEIPFQLIEGDISALDMCKHFDLILICSVLHHIPNLEVFFLQVSKLLKPNGYVIHLQDPNGDFLFSKEYSQRLSKLSQPIKKKSFRKLLSPIIRMLKTNLNIGHQDYIDQVNKELLINKIVKKPLTADEIWSITDIHVEGLPYSTNTGISFQYLSQILKGFTLVKRRSYGFFGKLKSELPIAYQEIEEDLIQNEDISGRQLACVWKLD